MPATSSRESLPADTARQLRQLRERYGIRNIRIFGSFARGQARPDSDIDLLADYMPGQRGFAIFRFCREAEELLGRKVDVATPDGLHRLIREQVLAEAIPL